MLVEKVLAAAFDLFSYKMATLDEEKMYSANEIRFMWVSAVKEAANNMMDIKYPEKRKKRKKKNKD